MDEIFEGIREETRTSLPVVGVPKDVESFLLDELVVGIVGHCLLKGRIARVHNEHNDSACEDIRFPAVIVLHRYLRSHVSFSAQLRMQDPRAVVPSDQAREPKIRDLENKVGAQQHILRLDVPMRVPFLMHIVDAIHHLMEVGPRHSLCELASFSHEVEELAATRVFQDDGKTAERWLIGLLIQRLLLHRYQLNQILVVKRLHDVEFLLESLEGGSFMLVLLDGN